jgi:hypothetical protein
MAEMDNGTGAARLPRSSATKRSAAPAKVAAPAHVAAPVKVAAGKRVVSKSTVAAPVTIAKIRLFQDIEIPSRFAYYLDTRARGPLFSALLGRSGPAESDIVAITEEFPIYSSARIPTPTGFANSLRSAKDPMLAPMTGFTDPAVMCMGYMHVTLTAQVLVQGAPTEESGWDLPAPTLEVRTEHFVTTAYNILRSPDATPGDEEKESKKKASRTQASPARPVAATGQASPGSATAASAVHDKVRVHLRSGSGNHGWNQVHVEQICMYRLTGLLKALLVEKRIQSVDVTVGHIRYKGEQPGMCAGCVGTQKALSMESLKVMKS